MRDNYNKNLFTPCISQLAVLEIKVIHVVYMSWNMFHSTSVSVQLIDVQRTLGWYTVIYGSVRNHFWFNLIKFSLNTLFVCFHSLTNNITTKSPNMISCMTILTIFSSNRETLFSFFKAAYIFIFGTQIIENEYFFHLHQWFGMQSNDKYIIKTRNSIFQHWFAFLYIAF